MQNICEVSDVDIFYIIEDFVDDSYYGFSRRLCIIYNCISGKWNEHMIVNVLPLLIWVYKLQSTVFTFHLSNRALCISYVDDVDECSWNSIGIFSYEFMQNKVSVKILRKHQIYLVIFLSFRVNIMKCCLSVICW